MVKEQPAKYAPNKFYICVPTELVEEAIKWCEATNPNYGVIEFSQTKFDTFYKHSRRWEDMLYFVRKAKPLHKEYKSKMERIALRLCSANINFNLAVIYKSGAWYEERQKTLGEVGTSTPKENNVGENNHG